MTDFALPPEGMLSEQIALPDCHLALGLLHIDGAGLRVCTWDGERLRHMSKAAALRFASELANGAFAEAWRPVIAALEDLAEKIDAIEARIAANKPTLANMPVEGNA